jgi:two-component system OmpR family sensor kinase
MIRTLRSIRVRLAALIILAMTALVAFLVVQAIRERGAELDRADANLESLSYFAARGERERFEATENFLVIASQAKSLRDVAQNPDSPEFFDACTRALYVSDRLVPGTRFTLWDTQGSLLCSSYADAPGSFSAADLRWFEIAAQGSVDVATGGFQRTYHDDLPAMGFGMPIRDPATQTVLAYLSAAVTYVREDQPLQAGQLPESGRYHIVDQDGVVVYSTEYEPGYTFTNFGSSFGALEGFLDSSIGAGNGRRGSVTRITDSGDGVVTVVVSASTDVLVAPLPEKLFDSLWPVALLTVLTLFAVWLLGERWVLRPVGALGRASQRLASGDLSARVHTRSGVTEFEQLGAAFNDMAEARERSTRAKDEFLGLVSHELKTPITTALGNAEILRSRGEQLSADERQGAVADIHESARRLSAIIDNLLVLARLERGVAIDTEPVALVRAANDVVENERRRNPGRLVYVRGDHSVIALAGETYAQQIMQNFIANAIKYSTENAPVEVLISEDHGMGVVRVLDRGPGIDESEMAMIFEPFYRSERTASAAGGIGVGLSVCARLVEAMGGEIWCNNRADGGCEFGFSLPLVPEEAAHVDEQPHVVPAPVGISEARPV